MAAGTLFFFHKIVLYAKSKFCDKSWPSKKQKNLQALFSFLVCEGKIGYGESEQDIRFLLFGNNLFIKDDATFVSLSPYLTAPESYQPKEKKKASKAFSVSSIFLFVLFT